jgi:hypothetical protein
MTLARHSSEAWAAAPGWEGRYEVSDQGRVRKASGRLLKQWPNDHGYLLVRLSGPRRLVRAHRLVAQAFIPNPERKPQVNHIDCDRANNDATNLEWTTGRENLHHSAKLGRIRWDKTVGVRPSNARLSDEQVAEMRALFAAGGWTGAALAERFGVGPHVAQRIVAGRSYARVTRPEAVLSGARGSFLTDDEHPGFPVHLLHAPKTGTGA